MTTDFAKAETVEERSEVARDLQLAARQALGVADERREWEITDASPRRKLYRLYSMTDGEEILVPRFVFDNAIKRTIPGTQDFAFTAFKEKAPKLSRGKVKCFLHPDSPEREVLNEIGIFTQCAANELRNGHSKRMHALHRHRDEWAALQEHIVETENQKHNDRMDKQTEAMMALAQGAGTGRKAAT